MQTSNGPADDGTGGGCEAAGVSASGRITPQVFNVDDRGTMTTVISGNLVRVGPNGLGEPLAEQSLRDDVANLATTVLPAAKGLAGAGILAGAFRGIGGNLVERIAAALGGQILGGGSEVTIKLASGALVTYSAQTVGKSLTVDISGAVAFGSTGTLFTIRQGLIAAARAEGANSLTIVASKVGNPELQSVLTKAGFQSIGETSFQGRAVQAFSKTISVK